LLLKKLYCGHLVSVEFRTLCLVTTPCCRILTFFRAGWVQLRGRVYLQA
jgi:hypothetical protein